MRSSLTACVLMFAACAAPPSPRPTVTVLAGVPAAPEAPVAEGPEVLVWTAKKDHPPSTRWLAPTADGYRRIAETSGLLIASGPDVWRWIARQEPIKTEPCESPVLPPGKGSTTRVFLEKVGGSERVEIVPPKKLDRFENVFDHSATPVGSIGPYLFVREHTDLYPCAAHGSYEVDQSVWDVSGRARVDLLSPEERKVVETSYQATAQALFSHDGMNGVSLDGISYVGFVPRYQARGWLGVEHIFTTRACYGCSDGVWSSSTRSVQVPAAQVPARAQAFVRPPPAVGAYLADHPGERISGWSSVSKDAAAVLAGALGGH